MSIMEGVGRTIPKSPTRRAVGGWAVLVALLTAVAWPVGAQEIVVAAAASLREPLVEVERDFEVEHPRWPVALSFGASSWLAAQIRLGAPIDLLLSADERQVDSLAAEGLVLEESRTSFASNLLVLVASTQAAPWLASPADLGDARLRRFALPAAAVPLGRYARSWLAPRGLLDALGPRRVQTSDARATLAAVELGQAEAALVYATDAALARRARIVFTPPASEQPSILYVGAVTRRGASRPAARAFLGYLQGPGSARLAEAGFLPPPTHP